MKNNPRSYQGNLKDNFPPPPVRYDAVQIVSVSHDDGEDYDVLDRGQGNSKIGNILLYTSIHSFMSSLMHAGKEETIILTWITF